MSRLKYDPCQDHDEYMELVCIFPLRPIRNEEELIEASNMVDSLLDRGCLSDGAQEYLDALTIMIEAYEKTAHAISPSTDSEMLRHLLEAKGIKQVDLARATGIQESTISAVLSGGRLFTRGQLGSVCKYFHVPMAVFSSASD